MPHAKGVKGAFIATRERCYTTRLAQAAHLVTAAGENLMGIGLVTHIPDQLVGGCVKHIMQGNGEFDNAQASTKMAAGLTHCIQQEVPQFLGKLRQLVFFKQPHVCRNRDSVQQGRGGS